MVIYIYKIEKKNITLMKNFVKKIVNFLIIIIIQQKSHVNALQKKILIIMIKLLLNTMIKMKNLKKNLLLPILNLWDVVQLYQKH